MNDYTVFLQNLSARIQIISNLNTAAMSYYDYNLYCKLHAFEINYTHNPRRRRLKRLKQSKKRLAAKNKKSLPRKRLVEAPEAVQIDPYILGITTSQLITLEEVDPYSQEFIQIAAMITNECFFIDRIQRVHNPFTHRSYCLKKEQKIAQFPDFRERLLFHGTRWENVDGICRYNFDWRFYGFNRGHKFGKGVNFSNNATYASNYCDLDTSRKVMFVAKVLIGKSCIGRENTVLPQNGYDTTEKEGGAVIVKYEDSEFYPAYKLTFHFDNPFRRDYYPRYYDLDNYYYRY